MRLPWRGIYFFFFAAGFALVVFLETGFFAAAMDDLLSWIRIEPWRNVTNVDPHV